MDDRNLGFLKNKRLLLVDDEVDLLHMLSNLLEEEGFSAISVARTKNEALEKYVSINPELVILDVMLPDGDGFSLFQDMKKLFDVPILFLTAKDQPHDLLTGLGLGADDYLVKPFLPRELILRIYAILRRCYRTDQHLIILEGCTVDMSTAQVFKASETYQLTAKEVGILVALYQCANKIVTIDSLCNSVWGDNLYGYENALMAHVCRLREKIEMNPSSPTILTTVKGLGYKLNVPL